MITLFTVLTETEAARINDEGYLAGWRSKLDASAQYASDEKIPFFSEDYLYPDTGYTTREAALQYAIVRGHDQGETNLVLVQLTLAEPVSADSLYYFPGDQTVYLQQDAARAFNTQARVVLERITVEPVTRERADAILDELCPDASESA